MGSNERARRISRLIALGAIREMDEVPDNAIPVDPDKMNWGYSGKITKTFFTDQNFSCADCNVLQTWFKEDQMWYFEETGAPRLRSLRSGVGNAERNALTLRRN